MATSDVANLRVHFYGTQGSGSIFPSRAERMAYQERSYAELLKLVFEDLAAAADAQGRIARTVEEILGGPPSAKVIASYIQRFHVPEPRVYGGLTTCVRVETADGHDIVLDCGSGFRQCARDLQVKWGASPERHLHLFGSHSHLDHTEGFDQAAVCFDPRNHLHIYGNSQFLRALDMNLGIFSHEVEPSIQGVQTPIHFGLMPATFDATVMSGPVHLGETTITPFEVWHPAPCLAYRIERAGRVFVFCTDHELRRGDPAHPDFAPSQAAEQRLIAQATGADLLYRDGQYLRAEYDGLMGIGGSGPVPRAGWGHSAVEDVVDMATACGIGHTLIGHHDPNRDWSERNWIDESMIRRTAGTDTRIEFARAETVIDL